MISNSQIIKINNGTMTFYIVKQKYKLLYREKYTYINKD